MELKKNQRIEFVGDSVTDCNRHYDAELGGWGSFGEGFVHQIYATLVALYPDKQAMVINKGVSGDNIVKMAARWQEDVLDLHPDHLTIMIGINDVWRYFDAVFRHYQDAVTLSDFRQHYRQLLETTLPRVPDILMMTPYMIEANPHDPMREKLASYQQAIQEIAQEYQVPCLDLQPVFDQFLTQQSSYALASDRVHPNLQGHVLIAKAWLEAQHLITIERVQA